MPQTRPPFVLAFAGDHQGCGHHRIMIPLASLVEAGVADGRIDTNPWPDHIIQAAAPDTIIFQRWVEDGQIEILTRWRKLLPDALFVYELDDYLSEIPTASFHAGFMPPGIDKQVARALALCDRVTTTTEPMADWLRGLGGRDVRVVPNGLPAIKLVNREPRPTGRIRVGFAGGISHSGDLEIIKPAMAAIGDAVEWVFFGTAPTDPPVTIEYHEGVAASHYLDAMAKLDIDLILAPLENNQFNLCKSNLRLIEAGAISANVIAQDLPLYRVNAPPVFGYATTPDEWTAEIRFFMATPPASRKRGADALRSWVGRYYILERLLQVRMQAWLPHIDAWKPQGPRQQTDPLVIACGDAGDTFDRFAFLRRARITEQGLEAACEDALGRGADVLWLRPATTLQETAFTLLSTAIKQAPDIASVVPLASDGSNAFPRIDEWVPLSAEAVHDLTDIVARTVAGRRLQIVAPTGPCVRLSHRALSMLGAPDVAGSGGNEEQAIMEWGIRASMREWKHIQVADAFAGSLAPPAQITPQAALRLQARGWATRLQQPSETLTVAERTAIELALLNQQWGGPRPGAMGFDTSYKTWTLLRDARAEAQNTPNAQLLLDAMDNIAVLHFGAEVTGAPDWVIWIDHTVTLKPQAEAAFMTAIRYAEPDVEVIYADHDSKVGENYAPEFKPDFDLTLLLAQDYITPLCAVRVPLANAGHVTDRIGLFEHVLQLGLTRGRTAFRHIPQVLGSMEIDTAPERMALDALMRQVVVQSLLDDDVVVTAHKHVLGCLSVVPQITLPPSLDLVSIIVPTLGSGRLIQPCVNTIRQHTSWPNYEIIVVQNGDREVPELGKAADDPRVRVVNWRGKFNWSAINNWAIRQHAKGDYIVTMNDDVCVGTRGWLTAMMGHMTRTDIGAVGARLLHPMGAVQHVGVVAHKGIAGHLHKGLPNGQPGHLGRAFLSHEAAAVTGACMLFRRTVFESVNGFDERMPRNYNDTDFCLRLHAQGRRNVVEMSAELLHPEGASRGDIMSPENMRLLQQENKMFAARWPDSDPYWNVNLSLGLVQGGLMIQGLNAEALAWTDYKPKPNDLRVLLINDKPGAAGRSLDLIASGKVPLSADLSGFKLKMTGPICLNTPVWDIREPVRIAHDLVLLGVTAIELRSMIGTESPAAPVETLRCLALLGVPVEVQPQSDADDMSVFGGYDATAMAVAYAALIAN